MSRKGTGGVIGVANTPTTSAAPGIWTVSEHARWKGASAWPDAPTVPGAPTSVSGLAGDQQVTVSFSAPASNGGSAVTGYTVTASPGGITASGSSSPIVVTGLTNGTSYTFTVQAINIVGTGAASSPSSSVIPTSYTGPTTIDVFMVGGGGAGGGSIGSGGGAGGILVGTTTLSEAASMPVFVGAGGSSGADSQSGENTTFFGLIAYGGGGGKSWMQNGDPAPGRGVDGGSGSGGSGNRGPTTTGGSAIQTSQSTLTGYGNAGGTGTSSGDPIQPGGGGGAGGAGQNGINTGTTKAGDGGIGRYNNFRTGSNIGYAGGGSGHSYNSAAAPNSTRDTWGGGASLDNTVVHGVANKGGGGAGGGFLYGPVQGNGGSGIVVIRYLGAQNATGGTVTTYSSGGNTYTVHTFTTSGTFTV